MTEAVIVALITAGASVICQLLISHKGRKDTLVAEAKKEQELNDRLKSIDAKLDEHNGYAKKLGEISESIVALQKDIEWLRQK